MFIMTVDPGVFIMTFFRLAELEAKLETKGDSTTGGVISGKSAAEKVKHVNLTQ